MSEAGAALRVRARSDGTGALARFRTLVRRTMQTRLAWLGVVMLVVVLGMALTANVVAPYDPIKQDYNAVLQPPSLAHPFGTDDVGRDVLSRVIYGSRVSLEVGLIAILIAVTLGVALGLTAGYSTGWVDDLLMRLTDALYSFPAIVLALAITSVLGPDINNAMIAIGIVYTPAFARLVRAQCLSVREREFVLAARVLGASNARIVLLHIWPNVTAPIIVQASLSVSFAIIVEATLSFLGVGVRPPQPSWGSILRTGFSYVQVAPWLSFFPGAAIFLTVLGLNFFGDGLRVALDPRLRERGIS